MLLLSSVSICQLKEQNRSLTISETVEFDPNEFSQLFASY